MGFLMSCGVCCALLSVWAILQLGLMGMFYSLETPILIEDVQQHGAADFQDFIKKTRANYKQVSYNCWATAGIYALTFIISLICIKVSRNRAKAEAKRIEDDELACVTIMPKPPQLVQAPEVKKKKRSKKGKAKEPPSHLPPKK